MFYYNLQLDKIQDTIKTKDYKRILIQMPDGLLDQPLKNVIEFLSSMNLDIFISGNPSYGVCDLALDLAISLNCDLIIHYGHSNFGFEKTVEMGLKKIDILLIPAEVWIENKTSYSNLFQIINELNWKSISLTTTIQHKSNMLEIKKHLESNYKEISIIGSDQIIGCNIGNINQTTPKVDGIISIHAGEFHTRGILLSTDIPLLQINPYSGEILFFDEKERKKLVNQRYTIIEKARKAKTWGILASTKIGQNLPNQISRAGKILKELSYLYAIILSENLNPDHFSNYNWIEAFINTACPRIATDDYIRYQKPILTFKEFLFLFNKISWDNLLQKGFF